MHAKLLASNETVRTGAAFGLILGLVHAVYAAINNGSHLDAHGFRILDNSLMLAFAALFGSAGFFAGRRAQDVRAAIYGGAAAACVSTVIGLAALWIATFMFFDTIRTNPVMIDDFRQSGAQTMDEFIIGDALSATLFATLFTAIMGPAIATVGGILAEATLRRRKR